MGARKWSVTARHLAVGCLLAILLTVLSVALLRHWRYGGLSRPFLIHGGSMAPSLKGEHFTEACLDCQFPVHVAVDLLADPQWLTCPNCGYRKTPLDGSKRQPGERVWIDRWARSLNRLRRWDPVAFHHRFSDESSSQHRQLAVKRVIGLPGEQIEIASGEIYANGTLVRKSMEQFRDMAILLFDTYYRPGETKEIPDRFQPVGQGSRWQRLATGYQFEDPRVTDSTSPPQSSSELDQLLYQHWACMAHQVPWKDRTATSRIVDHYPYNHGLSRGQLLPVSDLLFKCSLTIGDNGLLIISLFSEGDCFEVWFDLNTERYELRRNADSIASGAFLHGLKRTSYELEFAVVDHQVILVVNGRSWLRQPFSPGDATEAVALPALNAEHPLMIAARDLELQIHRMRLYRDIYWTGSSHTAQKWQAKGRLQPNEYLLLGDNVPVSDDCRQWGQGILRKAILGKVIENKR
jgi:signal peptidase I